MKKLADITDSFEAMKVMGVVLPNIVRITNSDGMRELLESVTKKNNYDSICDIVSYCVTNFPDEMHKIIEVLDDKSEAEDENMSVFNATCQKCFNLFCDADLLSFFILPAQQSEQEQ